MRNITIKVTGRTELLMHNGRLVNPMDPATKELGAAYAGYKRAKTDEAFEELSRVEFNGAMYHLEGDPPIGPYWPTDNFHACLKMAGAKVKKTGSRGSLKNTVAAALLPGEEEVNPLAYAGSRRGVPAPRDLTGLWADEFYRLVKPARVGSAKVMRTRPRFTNWSFDVSFQLDTEILDMADLRAVLTVAGQVIGLGDWRPEKGGRRGRFTADIQDDGEVRFA